MATVGISGRQFKRVLTRSVLAPLLLTLLLAGTFLGLIAYLLSVGQWVDHTDQVIAQANRLQTLLIDMETGFRGYLLTGDRVFLEPYSKAGAVIDASLDDLVELVSDNPPQGRRLGELRADLGQWRSYARRLIGLRQTGGDFTSAVRNQEGKRRMDRMRDRMADFIQTEVSLREVRTRDLGRTTWAVVGTSLGLAVLLGTGLGYLTRRQIVLVSASYQQALSVAENQAESLRCSAHRLEALHEIDRDILRAGSLDDLAAAALARLAHVLPCDGAFLLLYNPTDHQARVIARSAADAVRPPQGALVTLDGLPDHQPSGEGKPLAIAEMVTVDRPAPLQQNFSEQGFHSFLAAYLVAQGRRLGEVDLVATRPAAFTQEHVQIAEEVAHQLAIAVQQTRFREQLQRHAEELEQRVEERTAQLQETNGALEAFSYSISHDLRAPLRAMEGIAQALLEDYGGGLDATGQDYARRIVSSAQQMDALIQDLLAYSRLSRSDLHTQPVNLPSAVAEALELLQAEIRQRDAQVSVDEPLPLVMAHHPTLVQVVTNLLANAMKFVAPGTRPEVGVRAEERTGLVRLSVQDNGIGIAPTHQQRIFDVFERLHGDEHYPGTGIGLAIVRKGAERMGGRAGVESAEGRGSCFWVELPKG